MPNKQSLAVNQPYQRWLAAISMATGYLLLLSGLDKIYSPGFAANFGEYAKSQMQGVNVFGPYQFILNTFVIPNGSFFGQVVQYSETIIGLILIIAGLWNVFYYTRLGGKILALANTAGFLLMLNIILSSAQPLPWIDPEKAYATGMSAGYFVLLVTFFSAIAYFNED